MEFTGEISELDTVAFLEELPETTADPVFLGVLDRVKRTDGEERAEAVRTLGDFRVKQSVDALTQLAADHHEPGLRAAAITALGAIDHTTVFVPIIIALADDAREIRAAAARALSGLSIDRADAYALVVQQSDLETRRAVSLACIKSGIARQAIERLNSADRRQAYEAFATLAVLASSNEIAMILEAIGQSDEIVAIAATRVLGAAGLPDSLPGLRQMAVRDAISENVRTAILEVIYKIDQNQPV
jgi:HEAT repeat protein